MGCSLKDFKIGPWKRLVVQDHVVEVAEAVTKLRGSKGVVYTLDGRFQGFTGNEEAVIYHVGQKLKEEAKNGESQGY